MQNSRLPKSLHTVTAIVRVANTIRPLHPHASDEGLIGLAVIALGYTDASDPDGLKAKALAVMTPKEKRAK